ncbi:MAG: hypothetical protein NT180_07690 [Actinobacteria bacterium]|nr:hypothetical protein [Actinomycetota bacterium]
MTSGLGWPTAAAFDPDGPGPLGAPDGTDVSRETPKTSMVHVSRETPSGSQTAGLGWPQEGSL